MSYKRKASHISGGLFLCALCAYGGHVLFKNGVLCETPLFVVIAGVAVPHSSGQKGEPIGRSYKREQVQKIWLAVCVFCYVQKIAMRRK